MVIRQPQEPLLLAFCILVALAGALVGPRSSPVQALNVTMVSAGGDHSCVLTGATQVKCWGRNDGGQVGDGTIGTTRSTPVDVCDNMSCASPLTGIDAISAGELHACALTSFLTVKCWGVNTNGQVGDGTMDTQRAPVNVCTDVTCTTALNDVAAVSAGGQFTCALMNAGGVKCWGQNDQGQLGIGAKTAGQTTPVDVCADAACETPLKNVTAISTGFSHACAIVTVLGHVKCWGLNSLGQVGDGTTVLNRATPVDVCADATCASPLSGIVGISTGDRHSCALTTTKGLKCWGYNGLGQLGDGQACVVESTACPTPVDVCADAACESALSDISTASGGGNHACAVTGPGELKCWGRNEFGQLGDGQACSTGLCATPVDVCTDAACTASLGQVAVVSGGTNHTCALLGGGGVKCWGRNNLGQLGDGTMTQRPTPVDVAGLGPDIDQDGCPNAKEIGENQVSGGLRDPKYFWDWLDQWIGGTEDGAVTTGDILAVAARFGSSVETLPSKEEAVANALTPPGDMTGYHASADRGPGLQPGGNPWNPLPPDGAITTGDIVAVVAQFGHVCG